MKAIHAPDAQAKKQAHQGLKKVHQPGGMAQQATQTVLHDFKKQKQGKYPDKKAFDR